MSEGGPSGTSTAVVGTDAGAIADRVADVGATVAVAREADGAADAAAEAAIGAEPDVLVASGEAALLGLARAEATAPILPVAAGDGVRSVPRDRLDEAIPELFAWQWTAERHPVLSVGIDGTQRARALFDATLVSADPARISEFRVAGDEPVAAFRADGVVLATPGGSPGYARDTGGPVMPPETPAFVVEPISGFATNIDHWVLPQTTVTVVVERDETPVEVLADDRVVTTVGKSEPVTIAPEGAIDVIAVAQGRSPFLAGARSRLEKL
jgi:NAD+ kinase